MQSLKQLAGINTIIIPIQSGYNIGKYLTLIAGAGLTTASLFISGMFEIFLIPPQEHVATIINI